MFFEVFFITCGCLCIYWVADIAVFWQQTECQDLSPQIELKMSPFLLRGYGTTTPMFLTTVSSTCTLWSVHNGSLCVYVHWTSVTLLLLHNNVSISTNKEGVEIWVVSGDASSVGYFDVQVCFYISFDFGGFITLLLLSWNIHHVYECKYSF